MDVARGLGGQLHVIIISLLYIKFIQSLYRQVLDECSCKVVLYAESMLDGHMLAWMAF